MPQRNDLLAICTAAAIMLPSCSEQTNPALQQGELFKYREQLADGLVRKPVTLTAKPDNAVYNAIQAPARQCGHFWRTGDPNQASTAPALCDQQARSFQAFVERRFGRSFSLDDVRDPALWAYLMPRVEKRS